MSQCNDWPIVPVLPTTWASQGLNPSSWTIIQKANLTWGVGQRLLWGNCRFLVWLQN
jgi:hypothetical protein